MTQNLFKDMKVFYGEKIWMVIAIKDYGSTDSPKDIKEIPSGIAFDLLLSEGIHVYSQVDIPVEKVKPLLCFSDKDFIGSVCWSGDILGGRNGEMYFLLYAKYGWVLLKQNPITKEFSSQGPQIQAALLTRVSLYAARICSALDTDAAEKTGLQESTIKGLKEQV